MEIIEDSPHKKNSADHKSHKNCPVCNLMKNQNRFTEHFSEDELLDILDLVDLQN